MSLVTADIAAHSLWYREALTNDAYTLLACEESGLADIPLLEKSQTTVFGRNCAGTFVPVVTSTDPPGDLPASQLDFYEVWDRIHPLLEFHRDSTEVWIERMRFATPNNMDIRVLAKQLDVFKVVFTGGTRGGAPVLTGEGGPVTSNVTFDILQQAIIQLDLALSRTALTETENILTGVVLKKNLDRGTGYRGPDKTMYLAADTEASPTTPGAILASINGGGSFTEVATPPFAGNRGVTSLVWQPLNENSFRLYCGAGTLAAAAAEVAYYDVTFGQEATPGTPTVVPLVGSAVTDSVADIHWPSFNRLYIASDTQIFFSSDAGVTVAATPLVDAGQILNEFASDGQENVWVVGDSDVILKEDAGKRGTFNAAVGPGNGDINSIMVATDGLLYVGAGTKIFLARDGGRGTWTEQFDFGGTHIVTDIVGVGGGSEILYATGTEPAGAGILVKSVDGGVSWAPVSGSVATAGYTDILETSDHNTLFMTGNIVSGTGLLETLS